MLLQNNAEIAGRQFGLQLGEIAEGLPADLAILDYCPPTPLSEANFLGHLIFGLVDAVVDTTVCRGKILMQGKRILSMDEARLAARSRELARKCGHGCRNFNNIPFPYIKRTLGFLSQAFFFMFLSSSSGKTTQSYYNST